MTISNLNAVIIAKVNDNVDMIQCYPSVDLAVNAIANFLHCNVEVCSEAEFLVGINDPSYAVVSTVLREYIKSSKDATPVRQAILAIYSAPNLSSYQSIISDINTRETIDADTVVVLQEGMWKLGMREMHHIPGTASLTDGGWKYSIPLDMVPLECMPSGEQVCERMVDMVGDVDVYTIDSNVSTKTKEGITMTTIKLVVKLHNRRKLTWTATHSQMSTEIVPGFKQDYFEIVQMFDLHIPKI